MRKHERVKSYIESIMMLTHCVSVNDTFRKSPSFPW